MVTVDFVAIEGIYAAFIGADAGVTDADAV